LNAILRQVDLQERMMQQWVDYGNWRTEHVIIDGQQVLRISLDIVNPTSFPWRLDCRKMPYSHCLMGIQ